LTAQPVGLPQPFWRCAEAEPKNRLFSALESPYFATAPAGPLFSIQTEHPKSRQRIKESENNFEKNIKKSIDGLSIG